MPPEIQRIFIAGISTFTPVGLDALSAAAAVRAGISGFLEHSLYKDSAGNPVVCSMIPFIPHELHIRERFIRIAVPPLRDTINFSGIKPEDIDRLIIGIPAIRPGLLKT